MDPGADLGLKGAPPAPRNPVLRRPPVLEDYVNVTSTGGDRAFLVLRADPGRTGVQVGAAWPWRVSRLATAALWAWQAWRSPGNHVHTRTPGLLGKFTGLPAISSGGTLPLSPFFGPLHFLLLPPRAAASLVAFAPPVLSERRDSSIARPAGAGGCHLGL